MVGVINFFLHFLGCALLAWAFTLIGWAYQEGPGVHNMPLAFVYIFWIIVGCFAVISIIAIIYERHKSRGSPRAPLKGG